MSPVSCLYRITTPSGRSYTDDTKDIIAEASRRSWDGTRKPKKNGPKRNFTQEHRAALAARCLAMKDDPNRLAGLRAAHELRRAA